MATQSQSSSPAHPQIPIVPPLESGDCLSREEFERRYDAMTWLKQAELIEGVAYLGAPVSGQHGSSHGNMMGWLIAYAAQTPSARAYDNTSLRLDMTNVFQPDALLRLVSGGRSIIDADDYVNGPPELVAEVALSSASRDLHSKMEVYRRHGVPEYIVWRVLEQDLDWFVLADGKYQSQTPDAQGVLRSEVFPGLWLDEPALLRGEMATVLKVLAEGLASPDHARFIGAD